MLRRFGISIHVEEEGHGPWRRECVSESAYWEHAQEKERYKRIGMSRPISKSIYPLPLPQPAQHPLHQHPPSIPQHPPASPISSSFPSISNIMRSSLSILAVFAVLATAMVSAIPIPDGDPASVPNASQSASGVGSQQYGMHTTGPSTGFNQDGNPQK
jgi:hypothetical protein